MTDVNKVLAERGKRYGEFVGHAGISQRLKVTMQVSDGWDELTDDQREALEMIQHKVARILNGDPNYTDNWIDIAGYATLITQRLEKSAA